MREIALDTETTGLDPYSGHRIVEIGCVEMVNRICTGRSFQYYLDPGRDMPEEAYRVHGISGEFLKGKPKFTEVAEEFLAFIGDAPLVIHNAEFDMKFINAELEWSGRPVLGMERTVDTVRIARKKFPGSPANLDALCRRFEIDLSARTKHGALLDAELLADVYLELMGGRQASMFASGGREQPEGGGLKVIKREWLEPREFPAKEAELHAHHAFLNQLKEPLWLAEEVAE